MRCFAGILTLVALSAWLPLVHAQVDDADGANELPQVGWPAELPFGKTSGSFRIDVRAGPTTVQVEDPITYTVRITATGPVRMPPLRLALGELPSFREAFHIEELADPSGEMLCLGRVLGLWNPWAFPGGLTPASMWEFRCRLKPKSLAVKEIPELPFVFYNPDIVSADRRMMTHYADAIAIEVTPREAVPVALQAPASAFELATGPGLLARARPWSPPRTRTLILFLAAVPLACGAWYVVWRRLYPSAARQALQRRSRAARLALELLRRLPPAPEQRAQLAGTAVTRYLRLRLDLPFEEPTPTETATYLVRRGCSLEAASAAMQFYQACAAARFQPAPPADSALLPREATRLILAMEAQTCASP